MDLGLAGKVAVVTGASAGIGRAIAAALIAESASVVLNAREAETLEAAARELARAGAKDAQDARSEELGDLVEALGRGHQVGAEGIGQLPRLFTNAKPSVRIPKHNRSASEKPAFTTA